MIYIDFEFSRTNQKKLNLVSCSALYQGRMYEWWLYNDLEAQKNLKSWLINLKQEIFVAHAVTAEARCFHTLGLNPLDFNWIDTFVEFRLLCNHNDQYAYGTRIRKGKRVTTVSPTVRKKAELGREAKRKGHRISHLVQKFIREDTGYYEEPRFNLVDCAWVMARLQLDSDRKNTVRDIIIANQEVEKYKNEIIEYCSSDVHPMPKIYENIKKAHVKTFNEHCKDFDQEAQVRAEYTAAMAVVEANGIPLDMGIVNRVAEAAPEILMDSWKSANETSGFEIFYPLAPIIGKRGLPLKTKLGVCKQSTFEEYVESLGKDVHESWPRTESGRISMEDKVMKERRHHSGVSKVRDSKKIQRDLGWLDPKKKTKEGEANFYKAIGSDNCIRTYFGPYITSTGRNAAKARTFPLAMSSWVRTIMRPKPGEYLTSLDWGAQEIAIAAILSGDKNLKESYLSNDPYAYFACLTGAIPMEDLKIAKKKYPDIRNIYKATVLGTSYGMAAKALSEKLTADTKKPWSKEDAQNLLNKHREAYPDYYKFKDDQWDQYRLGKPLNLGGHWYLGPDNPSKLSVLNAPIQGHGAAILRQAVRDAVRKNIKVFSPLHDAIYFTHKELKDIELMIKIMNKAVYKVLPKADFDIRIDQKTISSKELYIEEKGEAMVYKFKHIIDPEGKILK
jgi:DNA polymerase I